MPKATTDTTRRYRMQVYVDQSQVAEMRRIEEMTGAPLAAQIRRGIAWAS